MENRTQPAVSNQAPVTPLVRYMQRRFAEDPNGWFKMQIAPEEKLDLSYEFEGKTHFNGCTINKQELINLGLIVSNSLLQNMLKDGDISIKYKRLHPQRASNDNSPQTMEDIVHLINLGALDITSTQQPKNSPIAEFNRPELLEKEDFALRTAHLELIQ